MTKAIQGPARSRAAMSNDITELQKDHGCTLHYKAALRAAAPKKKPRRSGGQVKEGNAPGRGRSVITESVAYKDCRKATRQGLFLPALDHLARSVVVRHSIDSRILYVQNLLADLMMLSE
jgi:hypothetical protein